MNSFPAPRLCTAFTAVAISVLTSSALAFASESSDNQTLRVRSLQDGHDVADSRAKLHRKSDRITVKVQTTELDPHEELDLLWTLFDTSEACIHGNPLTGAPCVPADLFEEATDASLHFVARVAADEHGTLVYKASLAVGDTSGCVPDFPCGVGLTNPLSAEVHSVLFN